MDLDKFHGNFPSRVPPCRGNNTHAFGAVPLMRGQAEEFWALIALVRSGSRELYMVQQPSPQDQHTM